jgi:hypothetical protein
MKRGPADDGASSVIGMILMVAITVLLVTVVAALAFQPIQLCDPLPPPVLQIIEIRDYDEASSALTYDSWVVMQNSGTENLRNDGLAARFYCDDVPVDCQIETLHGEVLVPSHQSGVDKMHGPGCSGATWDPNELLVVDLRDGTFRPGQTVRLDIVSKDEGCVISRHWFRH